VNHREDPMHDVDLEKRGLQGVDLINVCLWLALLPEVSEIIHEFWLSR